MRKLLGKALRQIRKAAIFSFRTKFYGHYVYAEAATDIGWLLLTRRRFEQEELRICSRFLAQDSVVIDIGANIGLHSVAFSSMVPQGHVFAIEPSPETQTKLYRNVRGLSNVTTLNVGMYSDNRLNTFYVAEDDAYSGLRDTKRKKVLSRIEVPCYRGDYLLLPLLTRAVDLIKVDVEGLESEVLSGVQEILQTMRPVVFCEIFGGTDSNANPSATVQWMQERGFRPYIVASGELQSYVSHRDERYNYFFVPEEKLEIFGLTDLAPPMSGSAERNSPAGPAPQMMLSAATATARL